MTPPASRARRTRATLTRRSRRRCSAAARTPRARRTRHACGSRRTRSMAPRSASASSRPMPRTISATSAASCNRSSSLLSDQLVHPSSPSRRASARSWSRETLATSSSCRSQRAGPRQPATRGAGAFEAGETTRCAIGTRRAVSCDHAKCSRHHRRGMRCRKRTRRRHALCGRRCHRRVLGRRPADPER